MSELTYTAICEDLVVLKHHPKSVFRMASSFPFKTLSLPVWLVSEEM